MNIIESTLVTAASMQVQVEIISYADGSLRGVLYNKHLGSPFVFVCPVAMVQMMEGLFDSKRFPEAYLSPRAFDSSKNGKNKREMDGYTTMNETIDSINQAEQDGTKCTFEIAVKFRQNATWQGQVLWTEKNLKRNFRSALEMLLLMSEALSGDYGTPDSVKWDSE